MIFYIHLITIVIPSLIQQSTQVPIFKSNNVKLLRHSYPVITELDNKPELFLSIYPLNKQKLYKALNIESNKKQVTANEKLRDKNINKKQSQQTDDDMYVDFDKFAKDNVMKYDDKNRRPEYDAYGKRYYRVATKDVNGDGVQHDMYEDDFGTRYYKLYVIDDRSGYVVINGVRYQRASQQRPDKSSKKKKLPLNQQIYNNTIQNFKQENTFNNKLSGQMSKAQTRNMFHHKNRNNYKMKA